MKAPWQIVLLFAALTWSACACETVKSTDIKTSGLYAELEADAPGSGRVNVKATLRLGAGSLTFLELTPGESLVATVGSTNRAMSRQSVFGTTWYEASFDGDGEGTAVKVSLARVADSSAPESVATLPAAFVFSAPTANTTVPRSGSLIVSWTGSGAADPMHLSAKGACIQPVDAEVTGASGTHTFAPFTVAGGNETNTCNVVITLVRTRIGMVDPAYGKGGAFKATVTRTLNLSSTP